MEKAPRLRLPLNLQFFAEGGSEGDGGDGGDNKPSYEDLVKQIATQKAEYEKLKKANDANSSQVAAYKKQLREMMDDEQRKKAEQDEASEATAKELEDLRKEVGHMKAVEKYRKMGMDEELAEATATAEIDGDQDKVAECFEKHIKAVKANEYQRFLDERKDPNSGRGDGKDNTAEELAKKAGGRSKDVDTDVLNHYKIGG